MSFLGIGISRSYIAPCVGARGINTYALSFAYGGEQMTAYESVEELRKASRVFLHEVAKSLHVYDLLDWIAMKLDKTK